MTSADCRARWTDEGCQNPHSEIDNLNSVSGDVVGALVVGPMADEPGFSTVVKVRDIVNETASRLAEVWQTGR